MVVATQQNLQGVTGLNELLLKAIGTDVIKNDFLATMQAKSLQVFKYYSKHFAIVKRRKRLTMLASWKTPQTPTPPQRLNDLNWRRHTL